MPQLNIETFVPQYVWFILLFTLLYVFVYNTLAPKVSQTIKLRRKATFSEAADKFSNKGPSSAGVGEDENKLSNLFAGPNQTANGRA